MAQPAPTQPAASTSSRWVSRAVDVWRQIVAVVFGYRGESVALRAGNLTFITITSLVPISAVILALVAYFESARVMNLVMKFIQEVLAPGEGKQSNLAISIRNFMSEDKHGASAAWFFLVVLISSVILLRHLDASINEIWAIRRRRPILASIGLYVGVLLVGPLLLVVALLGTSWAKDFIKQIHLPQSALVIGLGSVVVAILVFAALYKAAPHAHVPWRSAFFGGGVAGIAWELARSLYASIAEVFYSASPLYGSLGIAPLFLMWIYVSWFIVLSGARLSYAFEHADFHDEFKELLAHPRSAELIATRIATLIARANLEHAAPPTVRSLAASLRLPALRVSDLVFQLELANLVTRRKDELHPAREIAELTVADVSQAVGGTGLALKRERVSRTGLFESAAGLFTAIDEASVEKLKQISWADLVEAEVKSQKP